MSVCVAVGVELGSVSLPCICVVVGVVQQDVLKEALHQATEGGTS